MSGNGERPTPEQIREAMSAILDPEIGLPITDLGLVYDIAIDDDGVVKVVYTLTSMGCPVGPLIEHQLQQLLTALPGVTNVETEVTFNPPWSPEKMSEEARAALGMF